MSDFERVERYIVIKRKDITLFQEELIRDLLSDEGIDTREAVVAESHHPHYEETWENVQRWAEGRPTIGQERDEAFARGQQVFDDLRRVEADHKKCRDRVESLERLRKKAAALTAQVTRLTEQRDAALEREQALAAHVERLTGLLREHHEDFMSDGSTDWEEEDWDGRVVHALEDTPATSLARIKADAWREAGDEVMALSAPKCARTFQLGAARHIKYKAEKRRQAKGGE